MKKVLLSIIVPAFRAENCLDKLVDSLESQSFKDYEIIIINDIINGEEHTIKTTKLIKKLERKYKNIVRHDMPHTFYQGEARNIGINIAKGEYITFADSDDWYESSFFETIVPYLKKGEFELLVFNANKMNFDEHVGYIIDKKNKKVFNCNKGFKKLLHGIYAHQIGVVPWNKIYLRSLIMKNNILFEEKKKSSEDFLFNLDYITSINKYIYIDKPLYNYQLNVDVLHTNIYRTYKHDEYLKFCKSVKRIADKYDIIDYKKYLGLFLLRRFPGIILNETNNNNYNESINNIKRYINDNKEYLNSIKLINLDFKLLICYLFYKLSFYKIYHYILWKKRNK